MTALPYRGIHPTIPANVFIAGGAYIIGDVEIGFDSSVWFNVTIRGDVNYIRIGSETNIQDGTTIHVTRQTHPTIIGDRVTIGHNALLHGCTVGNNVLIGMGAIIMDGVTIEDNCIIGAGSLITPNKVIPSGNLVKGTPGQVTRQLNQDELDFLDISAKNYVRLKNEYHPS